MAAWAKRTVVLVALMAMVAGLTPAASAQPTSSEGTEPTIGGEPETLPPGSINHSPEGEPAPAGELPGGQGQSVGERRELVEHRTEDSRTFVTEDGRFETTFYGGAVHFRDAQGAWQPIDNTLVPADKPGALRNKAGAVEVTLPSEFGTEPVRAAKGAISVAFTLRGRTDTPSPGMDTDTPPSGEAMDTPPGEATGTPPPDAETEKPSPGMDTDTPPPGEATGTPPPGEATDTPPPGEATGTPPPGEATDTPPPGEATDTPPPGEATGTAPPEVAKRAPSPDVGTDTPSPAVAKRAPSPGLPKGLPAPASEQAAKASATYAGVLPGVDVAYTAMPEGVKEDVVLAGPEAPTSFDFTVETSPGLTARETPAGGIDFVDGEGTTRATFAPPFAYDASFKATGAESAFTEDAVSLRVVETAPELVVRLAVDPAWLAAPDRAWPVVLDPVLSVSSAAVDTYLSKPEPDANYGADSHLKIGSAAAGVHRPIYAAAIQSFFDEPVIVVAAELELYANIVGAGAVSPVAAHAVTSSWNADQATWNRRLTGVSWNSPGGDFASEPLSVNPDARGPGDESWDITKAAQAWVDGEANHGVVLKHVDESSGVLTFFASSNYSEPALRPRIIVTWEPLAGLRSPYAFEDFDLGDAGTASVNVASGNLTIADRDLAITGTGLDATVDRFYQSRKPGKGSVGQRWRMWPQSEERLYVLDSGDIGLFGGPEEVVMFHKNGNGTYSSPHGYPATLVYDGAAAVYKLTFHQSGTVYTFTSPGGYLRDIVDRNGNKVSFGYVYNSSAEEYYMTSMTDTQGRVTTFERASEHKVTKMVDPAGRTHAYAYDLLTTNLASYTDPAGRVTRYDYGTLDTGALVSRIIDPNDNATTFGYDGRGRLTRLTRVTDSLLGAGPTWRFDYSTPWQTKVTDPNGNATVHHFDRRGRVTKVVDALGHVRQSSYDSNSNVIDRTSATGNKTTSTFDANSNLTSSQLATGAKTSLEYTNSSFKYLPTKVTNPQGGALSYGYDAKGNLASVTDSMATPGRTELTYNANGTVASSKDPNGNLTTYGYDAKGNRTRVSPPAPLGGTTIGYDGLSRPTSVTDGKGQLTTASYDALDRLTKVAFAGGLTVSFGYDAGGRLTSRTDTSGTTSYVYDRLNRLVEERLPGGATNAYSYDAVGNLTSMTDVAGTVSYRYNAVNLVNELVEPGGATTTFAYDDDNNRTKTTYPNGVTQSATYDAADRLTSIAGTKGTATLTRFSYTYTKPGTTTDTSLRHTVKDKAGNITTYTYDPLDRLTQAQTKNSSGSVSNDYGYGYDPASNRTSETINGTSTSPAFNSANQLTSRGSVSYSYDANGNQTGSSEGQALAYNTADQTTSLKKPGGTVLPATYAGPDQIERASAGSTTFNNSLLGVSAATTGTTSVGYTRDSGGTLVGLRGTGGSYYLFDGLGSVAAVTDGSGAVTNTYAYDPYGTTTESTSSGAVNNPWRYTGQYQDTSTGLYKIGTRYYQPELGRWTQVDPLQRALNPAQPPEGHTYLYVGANPINFIDPTGTCARELVNFGLSGAGTAGAAGAFIAGTGGAGLLAVGVAATFFAAVDLAECE